MNIGAELAEFFYIGNANRSAEGLTPKSLGNFLSAYDYYQRIDEVLIIVNRLISEGILFFAGHSRGSPPLSNTYGSFSFNRDAAQYGIYDFMAYGFPLIRKHFYKAVRPVVVQKPNDDYDIGSGFLLENRRFVTAKHCILDMQEVTIPGWTPDNAPLKKICIPPPSWERFDLAVLEFEGDPFLGIPGFRLGNATVLEDVLTMGYPPIPGGFDAPLISTTGQLVAHEESLQDKQNYLLISARVKGGNSGGPVINRYGYVIGVVIQIPGELQFGDEFSSGSMPRLDTLGFGVAIPTQIIKIFLDFFLKHPDAAPGLEFKATPNGFCTLNR
jgi:serine protease Do